MSLLYGISTACEVWDQDAGPAFWGKGTPLSGINYDPKLQAGAERRRGQERERNGPTTRGQQRERSAGMERAQNGKGRLAEDTMARSEEGNTGKEAHITVPRRNKETAWLAGNERQRRPERAQC